MSQKSFASTAGVIFFVVTVVHGLRVLYGWNVVINNWEMPLWTSGVGVVVAGYLAYHGLRLGR